MSEKRRGLFQFCDFRPSKMGLSPLPKRFSERVAESL